MSAPNLMSEWQLFLPGLLIGSALALALSALGILLRVRNEAVTSLTYAQVAVVGSMISASLALPPLAGAWGLALCVAILHYKPSRITTEHQLQLLLLAWSASLLLADNHPTAKLLSTASIEGQLLLLRHSDGPTLLGLTALGGLLLGASSQPWLTLELLPWLARTTTNKRQTGATTIALIARQAGVVSLLAAGAMTFGVFGTLALVLIPASTVWMRAGNLVVALAIAASVGLTAHLLAFSIALAADQGYAAMLVAVLISCSASAALCERKRA